jgi:hypothetical protein
MKTVASIVPHVNFGVDTGMNDGKAGIPSHLLDVSETGVVSWLGGIDDSLCSTCLMVTVGSGVLIAVIVVVVVI